MPGKTKLKNEDLRRLRAHAMIQARVQDGMSKKEIAEKFNVSTKTVERTLTWAKKADLFVEYEDRLMTDLLPLAYEALKSALGPDGDPKIAIQILKGLNLLKTDHPKTVQQVTQEQNLADYIAAKREQAQLEEMTEDGELVETDGARLLSAGDVPADSGREKAGESEGTTSDEDALQGSQAASSDDGD